MAGAIPFGALPMNASPDIKRFQMHVADEEIRRMKELLKLSRVPGPIYENSLPNGQSNLGVRRDWLIETKQTWETRFDWRATESRINSFPNFKVPVKDQLGKFDIHFVELFSNRSDAVPCILIHGWPGSFLEFLLLLDLLKQKYTPDTLPYHIIVPSLPGFTLSKMPLLQEDISQIDVARIMNSLMRDVGFANVYIVQDGDTGSRVARIIAVNHEECKAVHLNFCPMGRLASATDDSGLSEMEREAVKRGEKWKAVGTAYALEQATRPSTIGFVVSSNLLALLAWVGEKFLDWTDETPPLNTILEFCSLYWLSGCAHSALWSYRHSFGPGPLIAPDDPKCYIKVPFGYSYYPRENTATPISWAAQTGNLVWSKSHEKGGHFAALEQPQAFMEDLEDFVGNVWPSKA